MIDEANLRLSANEASSEACPHSHVNNNNDDVHFNINAVADVFYDDVVRPIGESF